MSAAIPSERPENPIRLSMRGGSDGTLQLKGLTWEEQDQFEGALNGCQWVRVEGGRLQVLPRLVVPPGPADDEAMMPFWYPPEAGQARQMEFPFAIQEDIRHHTVSIIIQSLCAYEWNPERYAQATRDLESYGFVCLRSRREDDGKFWEIWYLPGFWSAKGELKKALELVMKKDEKTRLQTAERFLSRHVPFGTLDVSIQRMAMVID